MSLYTLRFSDFPTAKAAATALGFWDTEADQLRTDGQSIDPETGEVFGWSIAYCGPELITQAVTDETGKVITPAVLSNDVYTIVTGQLPPEAVPFLDPRGYGYSGHVFSDEPTPRPHEIIIGNRYTLRFIGSAHAKTVLQPLGYWSDTEPEGPTGQGEFTVQVIGANPTTLAGLQLAGYYMNIIGPLPAALEAYTVPYGSAGLGT